MKHLSSFHRLLLLRAIRPDRLPSALTQFVSDNMKNQEYIEQPAFDMKLIFSETSKHIPIFFVLFPGVDPTPDVEKVALEYGLRNKFKNISMGQGQE